MRLCTVLALAALAFCAGARADTLWYQMPNDSASAVSSQQRNLGLSTRAADDFVLAPGNGQNYVMGGIRARMVSTLGTAPSSYFMEIYADAGGAPGQLLVQRSAYLVDGFGVDAFRHPVVQPAFMGGYELAPGRYWLSVVGVSNAELGTQFASYHSGASSSIGMPAMYRVGTGAWVTAASVLDARIRDLSFAVDGAQRAPSQVPGAGPAGLLALAGAASMRRRRR